MGTDRTGFGWVGRTLDGQFRIIGPLGRGGMGTVYLAEQVTIGRKVVVKILNQRLSDDPTAVERFRREAKAIARLSHPNLIQVYVFGTTDEGAPYIAMEFVPGRPLSELLLIASSLPQKQAVHIAVQIFDAVAHAHATGVIHRDLKPPNIMLCEVTGQTDFVKVLDFGLAKLVGEAKPEATLTKTGCITGTPRYMSPEQARGDPLDSRSDIYSLGVILYEMLAGVHPHEAATLSEYLICHMSWPPRPFSVSAPGLQIVPELQAFVFRCLAKAPEERFQTAESAARALRAILDQLPAGEIKASISEISQMPTADAALPAAPLPPGGLPRSSDFTGKPKSGSPDSLASTIALPTPSPDKAPSTSPQRAQEPASPGKRAATDRRRDASEPPDAARRGASSPGSPRPPVPYGSPGDSSGSRTPPFSRPGGHGWKGLAVAAMAAVVVILGLWLLLTLVVGWQPEPAPSAGNGSEKPLGATAPEPARPSPSAPDASPQHKPVASPQQEPVASPHEEPVASPQQEPEASPQPEPEASPQPEPVASPQQKPVASPHEEPVASPHEEQDMVQPPHGTVQLIARIDALDQAPSASDDEDAEGDVAMAEASDKPPTRRAESPQDDSSFNPATEVRFGLPPFPGALEGVADDESVFYEVHGPADKVVAFYKKELARFKGVDIVEGSVPGGPALVASSARAGADVKFQSVILATETDAAGNPVVQIMIVARQFWLGR